jgi:hypothetical protein
MSSHTPLIRNLMMRPQHRRCFPGLPPLPSPQGCGPEPSFSFPLPQVFTVESTLSLTGGAPGAKSVSAKDMTVRKIFRPRMTDPFPFL